MAHTVDSDSYFNEWHGHRIEDLRSVVAHLRDRMDNGGSIIWLAGDSSLDNKYWLSPADVGEALNGYEDILSSSMMKKDVCYRFNEQILRRKIPNMAAVNTSVEATTLGERYYELRSHDNFISDHIRDDDYLVVSVGGNDIALAPSVKTIACMLKLVYLSREANISNGTAWGLGHFKNLFKDQVEKYIKNILGDRKPKKVGVCMIYFPDMNSEVETWAGSSLKALKYNSYPQRLQAAIRTVFRVAVQNVEIPGVEVVPIPLFEVMDGFDTKDYIDRVEPSAIGGEKMANFIMNKLELRG